MRRPPHKVLAAANRIFHGCRPFHAERIEAADTKGDVSALGSVVDIPGGEPPGMFLSLKRHFPSAYRPLRRIPAISRIIKAAASAQGKASHTPVMPSRADSRTTRGSSAATPLVTDTVRARPGCWTALK